MTRWAIAWRSVTQRALASSLTALSMAMGVALVTGVLLTYGMVSRSFMGNSNLGYGLIAGAKGGKLQLVLNTTYYLSEPVENIPYTFYQQFLSADQQREELSLMSPDVLSELKDGKYAQSTDFAIPVCLGDYYKRFRVIGTLPKFFELFRDPYDDEEPRYKFAQGRNFKVWDEEHGYYEAVVGSIVARETGLKLGDKIAASHGSDEGHAHEESPFIVVGILEPSGTPNDRGVFINMEGFYLMEGHAKPVDDDAPESSPETKKEAKLRRSPLPIDQREVTAVLIRTNDPFSPIFIRNAVNEGNVAQVVLPVLEITNLFEMIVSPIQTLLLVITVLICIVSGISILVSIYNSMNDRKHEIAVMRALGASRGTVMSVVLLESVILSVGGGLIGWAIGHGMMALASPMIEAKTGVSIGFFDMAPLPMSLEARIGPAIINSLPTFLRGLLSLELLIIPGLILLAVLVGFLPAYTAYKTDVAESLGD
ncbi:ABC transporter permease [Blastopirellula sp. JC732]|uniref:ABC transporter permease n=1 Tax=Blastopirellula sediminis TaxID=2894196 RepID=A0A9X1MMJ7_9BACT|nr:FtsX-like permease family protein [Blastopirellula sediminis]MCC9606805.1 ABC transporter permease [Blastopirellula sediminis]MCC9629898.1 ABC transporter permease [Blastopirellula sediminis]